MAIDPLGLRPPFESIAHRRLACEVAIGDVRIGGRRPIAVQSMTTTKTSDAAATAAQVIALARAGCDIVRVTVPARPDAEALPEIRRILAAAGVQVPLVADIHFTPNLALQAVEHVEKVRINPGNFSDKKNRAGVRYDQARWQADLDRLYGLFAPLVDRAHQLGAALRIGTNHGSLSDRIVERYGDSPLGMVESALEFVRIAEDRGHRQLVISMKASNPQVMVRAYRILVRRLDEEQLGAWPLHLGVTEAGGGDEGRIKSSAGISTLLADGLGDTIRVSLTEDPLQEIPVGKELVRLFGVDRFEPSPELPAALDVRENRNPCDPLRRSTTVVDLGRMVWGGEEVPRLELVTPPAEEPLLAAVLAARPAVELLDVEIDGPWAAEAAWATLRRLPSGGPARGLTLLPGARPLLTDSGFRRNLMTDADRLGLVIDIDHDRLPDLQAKAGDLPLLLLQTVDQPFPEAAGPIIRFARHCAGLAPRTGAGLRLAAATDPIRAHRLLAAALDAAGARLPLALTEPADPAGSDLRLGAAGRLAALLLDGIGDAVRLPTGTDPRRTAHLAHGILQACRRRLERAEYIACPSCGRTLFGLEETTARIRELTSHLKLKIAVMGCVVNGPGEMADADFGFVGWGVGKVALFVGRTMVEKDIPYPEAPERLVALIRSRGRWTDPEPDPDPDPEN